MPKMFFSKATLQWFTVAVVALWVGSPATLQAQPEAGTLSVPESLSMLYEDPDFTDIENLSGVMVDLRYGSTNNFMNENLYGEFNRAYLHRFAAGKLERAAELLQEQHPGWSLRVYDALRPRSVQWRLWDRVKDTPQRIYVADPDKGSIHSYGFAVDVTVVDDTGRELDMGTPFDAFTPFSQPRLENRLLMEGKLSPRHIMNRKILREVMEAAGFIQLSIEWWHFDALPSQKVRAQYAIVE